MDTDPLLAAPKPISANSSQNLLGKKSHRTLWWIHVAAIAYFCVGGPFGFEESLSATRNPALSFWALIIMAAFWALPQAMIIAELSTEYRHGYSEWVIAGLGSIVGTAHGWIRSVCNIATNLTYAALFADYCLPIVFRVHEEDISYLSWVLYRCVAVVSYMAVILAGNLLGVRLVGFASILFTLLVTSPFAVMFGFAAPHLKLSSILDFSLWQSSSSSASSVAAADPWSAITQAKWNLLVSVLVFNLIGWDDVGNLAPSVKRLSRDMPLGIVLCLGLVLLTYVAPLLSIAAVLTPAEYSVDMYVETCRRLWRPLGHIMSADALLGIFGLGFVYLTTSSEAQAHCSALGLFPRFIAKRSSRASSPWVAMIIQAFVVVVLTPFSSFGIAVEVQSWLYTLSVAMITLSFLVIRWRSRGSKPSSEEFRLPLPWWMLLVCTLPVMFLCAACMTLSSPITICVCSGFAVCLVLLSFVLHKKGIVQKSSIFNKLQTVPPLDEAGQVTACQGVEQSPSTPPVLSSPPLPPVSPIGSLNNDPVPMSTGLTPESTPANPLITVDYVSDSEMSPPQPPSPPIPHSQASPQDDRTSSSAGIGSPPAPAMIDPNEPLGNSLFDQEDPSAKVHRRINIDPSAKDDVP